MQGALCKVQGARGKGQGARCKVQNALFKVQGAMYREGRESLSRAFASVKYSLSLMSQFWSQFSVVLKFYMPFLSHSYWSLSL